MEGTRLQKVERLLQKELGGIIQRLTPELFPGRMVTITRVRVSPDLSIARSHVSVFPSQQAQATMAELERSNKTIRLELGRIIRHQLRIVPALSFHIDDSLDYIDRIDSLLKQ
ncbi:MAG: 30S ribosome-binding factor RbfA [Bacteroidales bacterium]|nr:30S ribosome-binding factor RbfA [Bacteroidales bacterium]